MTLYKNVSGWQGVPLLFVIASLSIVGCGGATNNTASIANTTPSSSGSTQPRPVDIPGLSKHVYTSSAIAQADAICMRLGTELNAVDDTVNNLKAPGLARLTALDVTLEQTALAQLSKLKPVSIPRDWQQSIADRRAVVTVLTELHRYAIRNDTQRLKETYTTFHKVQEQMLATAKRSGLQVCSHVG